MLCFLLTLFLIGTVSFTGCSFFPAARAVPPVSAQSGEKTWKRDPGISYSVPHGVPILMYHMIGNIKNNAAVMTADNFRWQMQYLKDNGYHPVTMQELYDYVTKGAPLPDKPICITFDDGYEDNYTVVYPIMKEYNFPWTIFVITGQVGTANRVTWDQLRDMKASHMVTIGNHTVSHPKMHELSQEEKQQEITRSQAALKQELGLDNPWFCYPYGDYDEQIESMLKAAGIQMAVTTDAGRVRVGSYPFELKRVWIGNEVNKARFIERLNKDNYSIIS